MLRVYNIIYLLVHYSGARFCNRIIRNLYCRAFFKRITCILLRLSLFSTYNHVHTSIIYSLVVHLFIYYSIGAVPTAKGGSVNIFDFSTIRPNDERISYFGDCGFSVFWS